MATARRSRWPWLWAGLSGLATVASTPLAIASWRALGSGDVFLTDALIGVAFPVMGAVILSRLPRHRVGWVMLAASALSLSFLAHQWANYGLQVRPDSLPAAQWAAWFSQWAWVPFLALPTLLVLWFPTGQPPTSRWRIVEYVVVGAIAAITLLSIVQPDMGSPVDNPLGLELPSFLTAVRDVLTVTTVVLGGLVCAASAFLRYRAADTEIRLQLRWFAAAAVLVLLVNVSVNPFASGLWAELAIGTSFCLLAAAIGGAILRHRLYGIDLVVNRSLVYAALSLLTAALYLVVVGIVGRVVPGGSIVLGTLAVAIVFAPLRDGLQRLVNRILYGDRLDPYAAVTRLSQRLETAMSGTDALAEALEDVRRALRVPYAEIVVQATSDEHAVAFAGRAPFGPDAVVSVPLAFQGIPVGELRVARRGPEDEFSLRDQRLLADLARQLGSAVRAATLTRELQQSHQRLVTAREEERRRLHRDLHDGLGPVLASVVLGLDGVRHAVPDDLTSPQELLEQLKSDVQGAVANVRRLVYDLGPPALDELGLVDAIRRQVESYRSVPGTPVVEVTGPEERVTLSAAAEAAAYRIVAEALTNVVRHAHARSCQVRVTFNGRLELEVADDGRGMPAPATRGGVGLRSMRERAAELGGECRVLARPGGGTVVQAWLPIVDG